ncbi:response regulator transcription factor [Geomicrobium sp. JCM 19038]|uniref:response regulator transcription factor n=1 Tax=Geomicrobium sp. JCM 19038 TaxID=1460635 RepID=UPI00045F40C0|nr:response regulator transcription factor [Geomicrobium sp. JCM 19038]GAK10193.1 two-component response regulator [Geomicrobium sp. JCM 19038]
MKLLIVDDDPLVRQSLTLLLEKEADFTVIGVASDGEEALRFCETHQPDVILMDIRMPVMDGIECTKRVSETWPQIRIMMLTTFKDEHNIRLALNAGAKGYVLKSSSIDDMAQQIRTLAAGSSVLDADVLKEIVNPTEQYQHVDHLTKRENDIVEAIAKGLSNQEIADSLFLSVGTVRNTLSVILDKLELRDRTQLAIFYWKQVRK